MKDFKIKKTVTLKEVDAYNVWSPALCNKFSLSTSKGKVILVNNNDGLVYGEILDIPVEDVDKFNIDVYTNYIVNAYTGLDAIDGVDINLIMLSSRGNFDIEFGVVLISGGSTNLITPDGKNQKLYKCDNLYNMRREIGKDISIARDSYYDCGYVGTVIGCKDFLNAIEDRGVSVALTLDGSLSLDILPSPEHPGDLLVKQKDGEGYQWGFKDLMENVRTNVDREIEFRISLIPYDFHFKHLLVADRKAHVYVELLDNRSHEVLYKGLSTFTTGYVINDIEGYDTYDTLKTAYKDLREM